MVVLFLPSCLILFKYHFQAYITIITTLNCVDFMKFSSFLFMRITLSARFFHFEAICLQQSHNFISKIPLY